MATNLPNLVKMEKKVNVNSPGQSFSHAISMPDLLNRELNIPAKLGKNINCPCPGHSNGDSNPSATVNEYTIYCHTTGSTFTKAEVFAMCRGGTKQQAKDSLRKQHGPINATATNRPKEEWIYSLDGEPYMKVQRTIKEGKKSYPQAHWNSESNKWEYGKPPTYIIYHQDSIPAAETIIIVEGEKCADVVNSLNLGPKFTATTSPGGAGKFHLVCPESIELCRGKLVVVLPDNDDPSKKHAKQVTMRLADVAASIKIVKLPDLPGKGDIVDFVAQHRPEETKRILLGLIETTQPIKTLTCPGTRGRH